MAYNKNDFRYWKGKVKWCRPHSVDPWGNWKTEFYPDEASLNEIRELQTASGNISGIKTQLKKDDDGYYISLRRPQQKTYSGKVIGYKPPEVLDGSMTLPDGSNPPLRDVNIGNGSDATVKVICYTHRVPTTKDGRARAIRWEAIRIDNLVPFTGKKELMEDEANQVKGLSEQPKPKW